MTKLSIGLAGVLVVIAARGDRTPLADRIHSLSAQSAAGLYAPDPGHLWNRVHRQLHIRTAADGATYGEDELDPLLWEKTQYLLTAPSNAATAAVLDEFLRAHAERLVTDPVKRAIFQHDLWVVFDWVASRTDADRDARRALMIRLARIIRRVALTKDQIAHLADNYAAAVKSGAFPARYNPQQRDRAFLPPDAFDANGRWINITGSFIDPIARAHAGQFSDSEFFVLLSVPSGAAATLDYLKSLWDFPQPFVVEPFGDGEQRVHLNPALPQVPSGTEVALVRKMMLIDDHGEIVPSNITESVQLRVFHAASTSGFLPDGRGSFGDQDFFEFRMARRGLFTGVAGGLHAMAPDEEGFVLFSQEGADPFELRAPAGGGTAGALRIGTDGCVACHSELGVLSLRIAPRLLKPNERLDYRHPRWSVYARPAAFAKASRSDWGFLQGLWQSSPW